MTFYNAAGTPLSDADAASQQWAGHAVFDVNGIATAVQISNVPESASGETLTQESEDTIVGEPIENKLSMD